ncbi:unnamed protein product [Peronospora belbahrii]|uniref:Uncharacterized protein n=1 Tax=Peronospora belbahrii TaxID=622444 RepID=A0ABN8DBD8_9STRA|nr:unnamed protein product [Peronospora belbahrii]
MVTSFLNQSEMTLLIAEIPSMIWASWTCCQCGVTPEHLSYQLHRWLTILTIVMGMNVVLVSVDLQSDIVGATIFLVADVVLTMLRLFGGRHRRRARREDVRMQRLTMIRINTRRNADNEEKIESTEVSSSYDQDEVYRHVNVVSPYSAPKRSDSVSKQCWVFTRTGVWKSPVPHNISLKEWAFAFLDCAYSLLVVLIFYETVDGSERQIIPGLLTTDNSINSVDDNENRLMSEVNRVSMIMSSAFGTVFSLSLAGRHYFLYSSRRQKIPGVAHYFTMNGTTTLDTREPNYFAISIQVVKSILLPCSICFCANILAEKDLFVLKQGVNVFVAGAIGSIAAARSVDAASRALYGFGRFDGDPPGLEMFGGSPFVKASTALEVFWDCFNDFLGPLSLDHLLISSTTASKNFIVVYFLLCVCVLHAVIAYVDAINIKSAAYQAERLGNFVIVTFLVRNSEKYVERQGVDLCAPVLLIAIDFSSKYQQL